MTITTRSASIRHYLSAMDADPAVSRRYSYAAARWEELRLRIHQRKTTPGDDERFRELSRLLKILTDQLFEPIYAEAAKKRQQEHGWTAPGKPKSLVADLPEVSDNRARDQAAKAVGASGREYPNDIPGLTDHDGFLPNDPSRLICGCWQDAASDW